MTNERDIQDLLRATKAFARSPRDEIDRELKKSKAQRQLENDIEMAERHVREGIERVERQRSVVVRLRQKGFNADLAEALLSLLQDALSEQRLHLERMRQIGPDER
ncbi:MAG TPA: hypothetical protein VKZ79_23830 [Alphaproteobacteria bacterium]|nr:hypothetical protein [Alphaproteobacteria bacterium]